MEGPKCKVCNITRDILYGVTFRDRAMAERSPWTPRSMTFGLGGRNGGVIKPFSADIDRYIQRCQWPSRSTQVWSAPTNAQDPYSYLTAKQDTSYWTAKQDTRR